MILDAVSPILYFQFFHVILMSSSHLYFGLPSGLRNIVFHLYTFLPFFLLAFDVNGQTNLIFVLLCNLLCFYVCEINTEVILTKKQFYC
jgi:hypothetical protein